MPRLADPDLPARRRAQILEAARASFRQRGFRQTTVEDICAEARISPGAFYRYFDAKTSIVAAIALDARAAAAHLFDRLSGAEALIEALTELARAFLNTFDDDSALLTEIWAEAGRDPVLAQALAARDRIALECVAAAIARAQRAAEIYPALAPSDAAETLMAALEGMALRRALAPSSGGESVRRFRTLALHILKPKR